MKKSKKVLAVILSLALVLTIVPLALFANAEDLTYVPYFNEENVAASTSGNYTIADAEQLKQLATDALSGKEYIATSNFKLLNDIDLKDVVWTPIGTSAYPFKGKFDGDNHLIKNLVIDDSSVTDGETVYSGGIGGVFGYVEGENAEIKNLTVTNFNFNFGGSWVVAGAVAANISKNAKISNCSSQDGSITLNYKQTMLVSNFLGGIVGTSSGTIEKCFSTANLYGNAVVTLGNYVGGIVGKTTGLVTDSYFAGRAVLSQGLKGAVGGIAGQVEKSSADGETSDPNTLDAIKNCYNVGIINGMNTGAIAGLKNAAAKLDNCFYYEGSANAAYNLQTGATESVGCTSFTKTAGAPTADTLGSAFKDNVITTYPFPTIAGSYDIQIELDDVINFAGGNGTIYNPYQIATTKHLSNVKNDLGAAYVLNNNIKILDYEYGTATDNLEAIKATLDDTALGQLRTDLGLGEGGSIDLSNSDVINSLKAKVSNQDAISDGIFVGGFTPIGNTNAPFMGIFDGNGYSINNLVINISGASASMFDSNLGTIKNLTLGTETSAVTSIGSDFSTSATRIASVNLTQSEGITADTILRAAAISAFNNGTITNCVSNVDVTITSNVANAFKVQAGGISAFNNGVISNSTNTGVILAKFTDEAFNVTNYSNIVKNSNICVAGLVGLNGTNGFVKDCKSSNSARSELTSASDTDGIYEEQYVGCNKNTSANAVSGNTNISSTKTYLTYEVPADYMHTPILYTEASGLEDAKKGAKVVANNVGTDPTKAVATYGISAIDNYQKVDINFDDTYKTVFFAWQELDASKLTVDSSKVKKEFIKGDSFTSSGLVVKGNAGTASEVTLDKVDKTSEEGYTVNVYDAETGGTEVTSLKTAKAGTYWVRVSYAGKLIPADKGGVYSVRVCDVASISVASKYETYMSGQTPTLTVIATYDDAKQTKKELSSSSYSYYIGATDAAINDATDASTIFEVTDKAVDRLIGARYTCDNGTVIKSETNIKVKLVSNDVKVSELSAIISSDKDSKVSCDNIQLTWKDSYAPSYVISRSSDNGSTWTDIGTSTNDTYTDSSSVAGKSYKYKVVMKIANENSSDGVEISETAPMPKEVKVDTDSAKKAMALGDSFNAYGIYVKAYYENDTNESLTKVSTVDETDTISYCVDSTAYNGNVVAYTAYSYKNGEETINVPAKNTPYKISIKYNKAEIDSYNVEVVPPYAISASTKYNYYPVSYSADKYKKTVTITALYGNSKNISNKTITNTDLFSVKDYDSSKVGTTGGTIGTVHLDQGVYKDNSIDLVAQPKNKVSGNTYMTPIIVPNDAPSSVTAEAGNTGANKITWKSVLGAVSYNVYRTPVAEEGSETTPEAVKIKNVSNSDPSIETDKQTLEFVDQTAVAGQKYTYSVSSVIADSETESATGSNTVTTVLPSFVKADSTGATKDFALGSTFNTYGLKVTAYYYTGEEGKNTAEDFVTVETNKNYEQRSISSSNDESVFGYYYTTTYDKSKAGTYTVDITFKGATTYAEQVIGSYTVTVYPVFKITVTMKQSSYPLNYELSSKDYTVKALYGAAGAGKDGADKILKTTSTSDYTLVTTPSTDTAGEKTLTVSYNDNEALTASTTFKVYDPDAQILLKDNSNLSNDGTYITNIQPNATVDTLKSQLQNDSTTIQIVDKDGTALTRANLATGDRVRLMSGATVLDEETVVVLGDTNGDGCVDGFDVKKTLNKSLNKAGSITGEYLLAANVNGDSVVDGFDVKKILNVSLGKKTSF